MNALGTRKLYENEEVAVWEIMLQPGEKSIVHTHTRHYLFYVIEGSILRLFDAAGTAISDTEFPSGRVTSLRCMGNRLLIEGQEDGFVPATHQTMNVGDHPYREILVELKQPPAAPA